MKKSSKKRNILPVLLLFASVLFTCSASAKTPVHATTAFPEKCPLCLHAKTVISEGEWKLCDLIRITGDNRTQYLMFPQKKEFTCFCTEHCGWFAVDARYQTEFEPLR